MEIDAAIALLTDLGAENIQVRTKSNGTTEVHCDCLQEITGHSQKDGNSASFNIDKELYNCFSCGAAFNVPQLLFRGGKALHLSQALEISKKYTDYIPTEYKFKAVEAVYGEPKDPLLQAECDPIEALAWRNKGCDYLTKPVSEGGRGVPAAYWRELLVHYHPTLGVVRFPCLDHLGRLVGWIDRHFGGAMKYTNSTGLEKSKILYGYVFAERALRANKGGRLLVVEGPGDVAKLHSLGCYSVVATLGVSFSKWQILLLSRLADEIVVAYDSDSAGRSASYKLSAYAQKHFKRVWLGHYPSGIKDPGEFGEGDLEAFMSSLYTPSLQVASRIEDRISTRFS